MEREVSSTAVAFSRTGESGDDAEFGWEDVGAKSRRRRVFPHLCTRQDEPTCTFVFGFYGDAGVPKKIALYIRIVHFYSTVNGEMAELVMARTYHIIRCVGNKQLTPSQQVKVIP